MFSLQSLRRVPVAGGLLPRSSGRRSGRAPHFAAWYDRPFLLNGNSSVENLEDQLRALISALKDGATGGTEQPEDRKFLRQTPLSRVPPPGPSRSLRIEIPLQELIAELGFRVMLLEEGLELGKTGVLGLNLGGGES